MMALVLVALCLALPLLGMRGMARADQVAMVVCTAVLQALLLLLGGAWLGWWVLG